VIKWAAAIAMTTVVAALGVMSAVRQTRAHVPKGGSDLPTLAAGFTLLYGQHCAGCHGAQGEGGAARDLTDEVFLHIADAAVIRGVVARGIPHTAMPASAQTAGGDLTDDQIDTIVSGLRARGANADVTLDLNPPPYAGSSAGDPPRGGRSFATFCARCHGADGRGTRVAGSIVDPAYLALVSDQSLRTTIIAGRPDLGAPDWRGNVPGRPMSDQEVSDIVAWLTARRTP
jgi:cytochrome c oxidase cbb3-type subunit 3